jgi:hypothetical protein
MPSAPGWDSSAIAKRPRPGLQRYRPSVPRPEQDEVPGVGIDPGGIVPSRDTRPRHPHQLPAPSSITFRLAYPHLRRSSSSYTGLGTPLAQIGMSSSQSYSQEEDKTDD